MPTNTHSQMTAHRRLVVVLLFLIFTLWAEGCTRDQAPQTGPEEISPAHVEAVLLQEAGNGWKVSVTVLHEDTGWDHFCDWWRISDQAGNELARRVLRHPHLEEQPFTRSLEGVEFPPDLSQVVVDAHCSVHGGGGRTVTVDMSRDKGEGYTIEYEETP